MEIRPFLSGESPSPTKKRSKLGVPGGERSMKMESHRQCDVVIGEPRTEGFGPKKHTTYRVSSRVRVASSPPDAWVEVRKRYSEFVALREALNSKTAECEELDEAMRELELQVRPSLSFVMVQRFRQH